MVCVLRVIFDTGRCRRLASILILGFCVVFSIHQVGFCSEVEKNEIFDQMTNILKPENIKDPESVLAEFDKIEEEFKLSSSPVEEVRVLFRAFVNEINARYGLGLTVSSACELIKNNLSGLQINQEDQTLIHALVELIESGSSQSFRELIEKRALAYEKLDSFYWPWEWNWFGLNKKNHKNHNELQPQSIIPVLVAASPIPISDKELPANCYFGAIELLAAPLVALLPVPGTSAAATMVFLDGVRRLTEGAIQLGEERRNDPNFVEPKPPF